MEKLQRKEEKTGDVLTSVEMRERLNFCPAKTIAKSGRNGAPITLSTTASIALWRSGRRERADIMRGVALRTLAAEFHERHTHAADASDLAGSKPRMFTSVSSPRMSLHFNADVADSISTPTIRRNSEERESRRSVEVRHGRKFRIRRTPKRAKYAITNTATCASAGNNHRPKPQNTKPVRTVET